MAEVFIDTYRTFDIYFNPEKERFYTEIDGSVRHEKQSFSSVKKFIDEYIKDNKEFKPFVIVRPETMFYSQAKTKVIGIRKDNRFIIIGEDGKKEQLSEYDEEKWILENESNNVIFATIAALKSKKDDIDKEIKEQDAQLIKTTVKSIKSNYII